MKNLFKKAHEMTREIVEEYNDVDYQAQFNLCLQFLHEENQDITIDSKSDIEKLVVNEIEKISGSEVSKMNFQVNNWKKYDRHRIYVQAHFYNRGQSHNFKSYIDLEDIKNPVVYHSPVVAAHYKVELDKALFELVSKNKLDIVKVA